MTAQPYQPAADRPAIDADEADGRAAEENEAGVDDVVSSSYEPAQDTGSGAGEFRADPLPASDPDLVVLPDGDDVSDGEPPAGEVVAAPEDDLDGAATDSPMAADSRPADLGEQWHDIQAMFVDDPPGSVQRAAAVADAAVSALAEELRERQAALSAADGDPADTEQLRETLRGYRILCQNLADVGTQLLQPRP
jgi:hypothetical protein